MPVAGRARSSRRLTAVTELTITRPDDWHLHLRDGELLGRTVADSGRCFARALVMPNLAEPIVDAAAAAAYRQRILAARPAGSDFEPLMTLYLTDATDGDAIADAARAGFPIMAAKLYPAGVTTNAEAGPGEPDALGPALEAMQRHDMVLSVHGEVSDPAVDVFDRERLFIERHLAGIVRDFPRLRIVLEHLSSAAAVAFVEQAPATVAATITAHHLLSDRNDMLAGGIRPHYYCMPVPKRASDRDALLAAATGRSGRFFLGTDSAPHARENKESPCGCAGCYTAHAALELYAEAFDSVGRLDALNAFAGHYGADFYGLPRNGGRLRLVRSSWRPPNAWRWGERSSLAPWRGGTPLRWRAQLAPGGERELEAPGDG